MQIVQVSFTMVKNQFRVRITRCQLENAKDYFNTQLTAFFDQMDLCTSHVVLICHSKMEWLIGR